MPNMEWLWPTIDDLESAKKAAHKGAAAAFVITIVTGVVSFLAVQGVAIFKELTDASSFIDAGLFLVIGFFIYRLSRIAAVIGLLLYIGEQVISIQTHGFRFSVMMILLTSYFIAGVRGTFEYHNMNKNETPEAKPLPPQIMPQTPVETPRKKTGFLLPAVFILFAAAIALGYYFLQQGKEHQTVSSAHSSGTAPSVSSSGDPQTIPSFKRPEAEPPSGGEDQTFHLKDGKTIRGKVLMEDDVYYTVETAGGRQEIVIKEDLA